jgi:DNA invertase Pin-like site-specific DNA recombinase
MEKVGLYARVSTQDQDAQRQLEEIREYVATEHPDADTEEFVDTVSGTAEDGGEKYRRMKQAIADDELDLVVVHELSRFSRLGGGEIHMFLEHAIEHETSVKDLEVGLSIDVDDSMVDRAVSQMIANIMGDLARIEHKQKLRRIESGIAAAQNAGKWTGRPPRGFSVEDGNLRVEVEEFLRVRAAIERVVAGESAADVSDDVGIPATTLRTLVNDRSDLYLYAEAEDDRVDAALDDLRPLDEPSVQDDDFDERVREIVRDEVQ